jgi:hypothetical protein
MAKKEPGTLTKAKAFSVRKGPRKTPPKLVPRDRKDLQLTDYLLEDHPEFGSGAAKRQKPKAPAPAGKVRNRKKGA